MAFPRSRFSTPARLGSSRDFFFFLFSYFGGKRNYRKASFDVTEIGRTGQWEGEREWEEGHCLPNLFCFLLLREDGKGNGWGGGGR